MTAQPAGITDLNIVIAGEFGHACGSEFGRAATKLVAFEGCLVFLLIFSLRLRERLLLFLESRAEVPKRILPSRISLYIYRLDFCSKSTCCWTLRVS